MTIIAAIIMGEDSYFGAGTKAAVKKKLAGRRCWVGSFIRLGA